MTPWARDKIGPERDRLLARADELGVTLGAMWSSTHREWWVSADGDGRRIEVKAKGALSVALDGAMNRWESAYTAEELLTIASQSGMEVRRA